MREIPRGTVTLLFTDIEGSTRLLQQVGERYADVFEACRHLLRTTFRQYHGHEVDTQGDAFFVAFARATDAVAAAVAAQRALYTHVWPHDLSIRVRMGLHTGEPQLASEGYVGLDVHHAARIMSTGHGGQVLLSRTTGDLVEHALPEGVSLLDLGAHRLKDLQQASQLFQLVIAGLPTDFPLLKTLDSYPNNLPLQPTPFIGREREVDAVQQQLLREEVHLVTLTGPGGVGKTRMALQVAAESSEHFTDGTWFVSLAPLTNPDLVISTIIRTLGLRETQDQAPLEHLKNALHVKKMLLLLDNFEQVVSAATQVADLLTVCQQLKVLATSRETLHVLAEHEFPVPAMALPDPRRLQDLVELSQYEAMALFIERAQAVKPDFKVTNANAPAVQEICARLDGLPLAIELAAARIKLLPPQALLARLDQRLAVLTSGARDAPVRQQTLRNTIAWSYNLLETKEQQLFRRLSIFVGGCTLEAIEAIYIVLDNNQGAQVLDRVAALIDKNLLQQTEQEGERPRLVMLETIREYALEALVTFGEMENTRQAHATYYQRLAEEAEPELYGPIRKVWWDRLEREHENLRAALQWVLDQARRDKTRQSAEMALRFGGALRNFWAESGYWNEGRTFLEQALTESTGIVSSVRTKALIAVGHLAFLQGDYDRTETLCKEILAVNQKPGATAGSLQLLGYVAWYRGNLVAAHSLMEQALTLQRELGDKRQIAISLYYLANLERIQGEYARGCVRLEEGLAINRELGNTAGIASFLYQLAKVLFFSHGDMGRIRSLLEESVTLSRETGDEGTMINSILVLGRLALSQGDAITARALAEQCVMLSRKNEMEWGMRESLPVLASVVASQGDLAKAQALYEESLAIKRGAFDKELIATALEGLASVAAAQGKSAWSAQLWGVAEALRESLGAPIPLVMRATTERSVAAARAQLGKKTFIAAWEEGRAMTVEQALAGQGRTLVPTATLISPDATVAPPAKSPITYPAGLTAREVEVLRLVAQGLTDAQVAERLVISPRTVNTHLTSIYNKLSVDSRTAASRFAIEKRLV